MHHSDEVGVASVSHSDTGKYHEETAMNHLHKAAEHHALAASHHAAAAHAHQQLVEHHQAKHTSIKRQVQQAAQQLSRSVN